MARILAIDWEQRTLHVVSANAKRKAAVVERAFTLPLETDLTAANGEAIGRALRDALKAQGIAPAPVVVCIGRDRMLVKDIEYPQVPEADEPGLVRMQASKHLADAGEELAIDYAPIGPGLMGGTRQAIIVAIKRSILTAAQALCRGAGLKLAGCTGRPLALMAALDRYRPAQEGELRAVLGMGPRWSEFCISRGSSPLMARSLATGPTLGAEVQRNLTLFATRTGNVPAVLFVTGCEDNARHKLLTDGFLGEVQLFRPSVAGDAQLADPAPYAAAIGLAHLSSQNENLPINWASPKQPRAAVNRPKEWTYAAVGISAAAVLLLLVLGWRTFAGKRQQIEALKKEQDALVKELKAMDEEVANNDALRDWEEGSISWLDEMYDLSARFPNEIGLHLKQVNGKVTATMGRKEKNPFVASMNVSGVVPPGKDNQVERLQKMIQQDKHLRITPGRSLASGAKSGEFEFTVELSKLATDSHTMKLVVPKLPTPPAAPLAPADKAAEPAKEAEKGEEGGNEP